MKVLDLSVNDIFQAMSEGERCHMANKLYKEGYEPIKMRKALEAAKETPAQDTQFTEDELKMLWHRINVSDFDFERLYSGNGRLGLLTQYKALEVNTYGLWRKINDALGGYGEWD